MGCDIHIYPEYWTTKNLDCGQRISANSICEEFSVGRCYKLFSIMAGVRGCGNNAIVQPRGLPEGTDEEPSIGWMTEHKITLTVVPDHEIKTVFGQEDRCVSQSTYDSWTVGTGSFRPIIRSYKTVNMHDGTSREMILHPDYHSISWLTLPELLEVRKRYITEEVEYNYQEYKLKKKDTNEYKKILKEVKDPEMLLKHNFGPFEYASLNGLIGMLYFMEKSSPNIKSRIVFWFDS